MPKSTNDFMALALKEAKKAYALDEVPVGAVVVKNGEIVGAGFNQVISQKSVASHAEINAIISASNSLDNYRLNECDIYVTLEPCHMCAKAIVDARFKNLFFGNLATGIFTANDANRRLNALHTLETGYLGLFARTFGQC